MGRLASGVAWLALAAVQWVPIPAAAQSLATLHVRTFTIAADRTSVRVGEAFHITMTAHLDERVSELDNVTLPDLAGFDVSGDERRCGSAAHGTDCSETLTLSASYPGNRSIGPWRMDAVDARNHRPSRFASNTIVIFVSAPPPLDGVGDVLRGIAYFLLGTLAIVVVCGLALWLLIRTLARRPKRVRAFVPAQAPVSAPVPASPVARVSLQDLVDALDREPTRAHAVAVRAALRDIIGAREDETFADLVARFPTGRSETLAALRAVERAAFCEDAAVAAAVREALPFLTH